jgi:L-rhamnose-H+ transport protein
MIITFALVIFASFFLGTFGLGMKYNKPLSWEAFWGIHAITGMLIIPTIWALLVIPHLRQSIATAPSEAILKGILFGFIWGIGGVLFGVSIKYVGVSLTYGIVMGLTDAIGALIPLFQMQNFASQKGFPVIILGVVIMLTGVATIAYSGIKRETLVASLGTEIEGIKSGKEFRKGIFIVIISGIFSAFINIGFANALPVARNAVSFGASEINSSIAAWVVVLWGAIAFNLLYVLALLIKNKSWKSYTYPHSANAYKWAILAALLWFGSLAIYGYGAAKMGELGTVIGWPVFVGLSLIFSNMWAVLSREWKSAKEIKKLLYLGILILIIATMLLAYANAIN